MVDSDENSKALGRLNRSEGLSENPTTDAMEEFLYPTNKLFKF